MSSSSNKSDRNQPDDLSNPDKRRKVVSEVAAIRGVTKSGLARILQTLNNRGYLKDPLVNAPSLRSHRRSIQTAVESDGLKEWTPYGFVIQEFDLGVDTVHYINPFSLLHHLCVKFGLFYELLCTTIDQSRNRLRILIYVDEINPGDPLHPDPQRMLQAVYWTFCDFPSWFLQRTDAWFCFGLIRSLVIYEMPGGMSEFCDKVLQLFFPKDGLSWSNGVTVRHDDRSRVVAADFFGLLADEKALKEIFDITGQAGSYPCFDHINVCNRWVAVDNETRFKMWDPDRSKLIRMTRDHLDVKVDHLRSANATLQKQSQTKLGLN